MAFLCAELHMTPAEYWSLRVDEMDALVRELKTRQKLVTKVVAGGG